MSIDKKKEFLARRERFLNKEYKNGLRQIMSYFWDYKKIFWISFVLGIVQSLLFMTLPLLLAPTMDILVDPKKKISDVVPIFALMIFLQALSGIIFGIRIYMNRWAGANVIYNLRNDLFSTIQIMSWPWLDENKTGELISRTTSDVNLLKEFLANNFQFFIRQLITIIISYMILFILNVKLAFWVLSISPFLFVILVIFRWKMRPVFKKSRETYADLTSRIEENVKGINVVKSFGREDYEIEKFKKINDQYFNDSMDIIKLQSTFDPVIFLIDNIAFLIVLLLGGVFVLDGEMTFGQLFAFVLVLNFTMDPLYFISRFVGNMPQVSETCERAAYVLNSKVVIQENSNAVELPQIQGEVEFKNVYFAFDQEKKNYILRNVNLKVKPGETIAILGATGSGKSAFIKLIPRFYDVAQGEILIDGINVKDVKLKSLRKQIGYVSQDRLLFSRTIKENIAFGKRDLVQDEIEKAAMAADIHDYIVDLAEKYNTKVGERGLTVSGGQRQRISIARALAIKPRILILDDATSSVDVDTEYKIQSNFKEVFKGCTTFIITQRLSTVRNATRIVVLENGEIVQIGTHDELMKQTNGIYRKLYTTLKVEERAA